VEIRWNIVDMKTPPTFPIEFTSIYGWKEPVDVDVSVTTDMDASVVDASTSATDATASPGDATATGGTVSIRAPLPDWQHSITDDLSKNIEKHKVNFENVDSIGTRKLCNKDEEQFVQSFINHVLQKADKNLQDYMKDEMYRVNKLMTDIEHMISLEMALSRKDKVELKSGVKILARTFKVPFYLYESDLSQLKEMKDLNEMERSTFPKTKTIAKEQIGKYMIRIAKRLVLELTTALKRYLDALTTTKASFEFLPFEPLGKLCHLRRFPWGSEGDRISDSTKVEAYNEDSPSQYCNEKNKPFRQRTVKLVFLLNTEEIVLPEAVVLLESLLKNGGLVRSMFGKAKLPVRDALCAWFG
jgi:hypothetical protein